MAGIRCREIVETDFPALTILLMRGFPTQGHEYWSEVFQRLTRHHGPQGFPRYGYVMEADHTPVGVILLIYSTIIENGKTVIRCNLSSWYVEPPFRAYATIFHHQAFRHKDVTYVNISPKPHTWPIVEAQGFERYCDGVLIAVPILSVFRRCNRVELFNSKHDPNVAFETYERDLLLQHAAHGCTSLWCLTSERAHPFVFRRRRIKGLIPCAQLVYCRDISELAGFAGSLGRFLAARGIAIVILDANGPMPGLAGAFFRDRPRKYFKGPQRPRIGDLAYTERAMWGG